MAALNTVYFITVDYIKKYYSGYVDQNIDADAINSFILISQDMRTQSILGYDLYNKYINDIISTNSPVGAQYIYLMDNFIQKSLALWSIWSALPSLSFKLTNKALSQKSSEYGQPVGQKDIEYIRQEIQNNATWYDSQIQMYLKNYPGDFPEYWTNTGVDRTKAKNNAYMAGLYLPDMPPIKGGRPFFGDSRCCDGRGSYLNW